MEGTAGRLPPQALDLEKAILGAMLIEQEAIPRALEILTPESFYLHKHRLIYEGICSLFKRSVPVDLLLLSEELAKKKLLDDVDGAYYLSELSAGIATAANVEYHALIVAQKALQRALISLMTNRIGEAYDPSSDAFELLDQVAGDVLALAETHQRRSTVPLKKVIKETVEHLQAIHGREAGITGVPSGFSALDRLTGGWQPSDLIIIAARPSMGKTALALACARNASMHSTLATPTAIFSLEMSSQQLAQRLLTSEARVNAQAARTGRLKPSDWNKMVMAAGRLDCAPIFLDDTPGLGILELRAKARSLRTTNNIGLIVVDYLQLMHGAKTPNREQEIAQISRSLKSLAKELHIPVIALSQLNRAVENRGGDKRPQLSDLRESGSIEQDADVVAFIYRAERYGIMTDDNNNPTEGVAEIIIGKQRNGPTGTVSLGFVKDYARFENLETHHEAPPESEEENDYEIEERDDPPPF